MEKIPSVKVSKRYQIAVPAEARRRLNIHSGDRLIADVQDGLLILMPEPVSYTQHLSGLYKEIWDRVDGQAYVARERDAWDETSES